jgi:uncharacterized membrane protein YgaE (UPF0421/DUF939 family)
MAPVFQEVPMNTKILNISLMAGVAYFCCMAVAHFFGLKYPLVFVYYDVPFQAYQDKIISFAVVAYICLFYTAATIRAAVPAALLALAVTVLGLSAVNLSDALQLVLAGRSTAMYWAQTGLIAAYWLWLVAFYLRARAED